MAIREGVLDYFLEAFGRLFFFDLPLPFGASTSPFSNLAKSFAIRATLLEAVFLCRMPLVAALSTKVCALSNKPLTSSAAWPFSTEDLKDLTALLTPEMYELLRAFFAASERILFFADL